MKILSSFRVWHFLVPALLGALLIVLSGCINHSAGTTAGPQLEAQMDPSQTNTSPPPEHMVGGWTKQPTNWAVAQEDMVRLKEHLAKAYPDIILGALLRIESQVVAGFNVKLDALYTQAGHVARLEVRFFHNLDHEVELKALELGLPIE